MPLHKCSRPWVAGKAGGVLIHWLAFGAKPLMLCQLSVLWATISSPIIPT